MLTQDKLKKLQKYLTGKISKASKKISLNLKIQKVRANTYNKQKNNSKNSKFNNQKNKNNKNKENNKIHKDEINKTFQNNISVLSDIKQDEDNFYDSFISYITENNLNHKNKIKSVSIIKNNTRELYDKALLYHIMKYYTSKSNIRSMKIDNLGYLFKPMTDFLSNSRTSFYENNSNEKKKYIIYDNNFNFTFGKKTNNNTEFAASKNKSINDGQIKSVNLMNNQIFNNNFIFNINNYRGNAKSAKNKIIKNIINEENAPSFHKENSKENIKKHIIKDIEKKKINLPKNYINIEELKKNNHIIMNLLHKKKAIENANNISGNKQKNNFVYPKANSARKKISLIEEINNRIKYRYNKKVDIKYK